MRGRRCGACVFFKHSVFFSFNKEGIHIVVSLFFFSIFKFCMKDFFLHISYIMLTVGKSDYVYLMASKFRKSYFPS